MNERSLEDLFSIWNITNLIFSFDIGLNLARKVESYSDIGKTTPRNGILSWAKISDILID